MSVTSNDLAQTLGGEAVGWHPHPGQLNTVRALGPYGVLVWRRGNRSYAAWSPASGPENFADTALEALAGLRQRLVDLRADALGRAAQLEEMLKALGGREVTT